MLEAVMLLPQPLLQAFTRLHGLVSRVTRSSCRFMIANIGAHPWRKMLSQQKHI